MSPYNDYGIQQFINFIVAEGTVARILLASSNILSGECLIELIWMVDYNQFTDHIYILSRINCFACSKDV